MDLINNHIIGYLESFINELNPSFDQIFDNIQNDLKLDHKSVLKYLFKLIDFKYLHENIEQSVLHIHFDEDFSDDVKLLLAEFLTIYLFINSYSLENRNEDSELTQQIIKSLETRKKSLQLCPEGASKKNRIALKWESDKKTNTSLLKFYKSFSNASLLPHNLFNTQVKFIKSFASLLEKKPFAVEIENYPQFKSYCILNSEKGLNELDEYVNLVDCLETLIFFDCERKRLMANFSLEEINKWNKEFGTNFKKYFVITFGKEPYGLQGIRNKIESIKERFKIPKETTYTLLYSELDILLNREKQKQIPVEFIGIEDSIFWDSFLLETSIRELYELRSIKMMNTYSLCLSQDIKKYVLEELFDRTESSKLISYNTKQALLEIRKEDLGIIKGALSNTLDLIIESDLKAKIIGQIKDGTILIIDDSVIKDHTLQSKISSTLSLNKTNKIIAWSAFDTSVKKPLLILSYRDQGKFPNHFNPNIIESLFPINKDVSAFFINFFFGHHYQWSKYNLYKDLNKYLDHQIRQNNFNWNKLKSSIETLRPLSKLNIDWSLENEYSYYENRETYKVKLRGVKTKTYNSSDLFISRNSEYPSYKVDTISNLKAIQTNEEVDLLQNLDEIQENINIYEKIIDTKKQEAELNIIRKQFNLGDESAGRLWKILLKNSANSRGEETFYNELKSYLEAKKLSIVSFSHYKNSWINPQSESIAPLSNRVFIALCEFLNIPKIYFVIIQRIKNASKQSSRRSTRQMNQLLRDLFNDGCFDEGINTREIIRTKLSFYKDNHPLDELGIDENYLLDNLVTLTELIEPELNLREVEFIEKSNNE